MSSRSGASKGRERMSGIEKEGKGGGVLSFFLQWRGLGQGAVSFDVRET